LNEWLDGHDSEFSSIGVVPGHEYAIPLAAEFAKLKGWRSLEPNVAYTSCNKEVMKKSLQMCDIPVPKGWCIKSEDEFRKIVGEVRYPVIAKPVNMVASMYVKLINDRHELEEHVSNMLGCSYNFGYEIHQGFLVEEYVEGPEYSIECFMNAGECIFQSITKKGKGMLPFFVELEHTVPACMDEKERNEINEFARNVLLSVGITDGPVHLEFVASKDGPVVIEYGTRPPGGRITRLLNLAGNVDIHKASIMNALSKDPRRYLGSIKRVSRVRHFFIPRGTLEKIDGTDVLKETKGIAEWRIGVKPGDVIGPYNDNMARERAGYYITVADDMEELERICRRIEESVIFHVKSV
jgi:biotin carboxylase